jgi:hypothetical protein
MPSFQLENGPVIEWSDTRYVVVGSKWKSGFLGGGEWVVKWKKEGSNSTQNFRVSKNTSGGTAIGGYKVHK